MLNSPRGMKKIKRYVHTSISSHLDRLFAKLTFRFTHSSSSLTFTPNVSKSHFRTVPLPFKNMSTTPPTNEEDSHILSNLDVLMGRGSGITRHPGNISFRALVDSYRPEYRQAARNFKQSIAAKIVDEIYEKGGKFVQRIENEPTMKTGGPILCNLVSRTRAVEKTCQALRELILSKGRAAKSHQALRKKAQATNKRHLPTRNAAKKIKEEDFDVYGDNKTAKTDVISSKKKNKRKPKSPKSPKRKRRAGQRGKSLSVLARKAERKQKETENGNMKQRAHPPPPPPSTKPAMIPFSDDEASSWSLSSEYDDKENCKPQARSAALKSVHAGFETPRPSSASQDVHVIQRSSVRIKLADICPAKFEHDSRGNSQTSKTTSLPVPTFCSLVTPRTDKHQADPFQAATYDGSFDFDDISCVMCGSSNGCVCSCAAPSPVGCDILVPVKTSPIVSHTPPRRVSYPEANNERVEMSSGVWLDPWDRMLSVRPDDYEVV